MPAALGTVESLPWACCTMAQYAAHLWVTQTAVTSLRCCVMDLTACSTPNWSSTSRKVVSSSSSSSFGSSASAPGQGTHTQHGSVNAPELSRTCVYSSAWSCLLSNTYPGKSLHHRLPQTPSQPRRERAVSGLSNSNVSKFHYNMSGLKQRCTRLHCCRSHP